jgi:hypothetical protein
MIPEEVLSEIVARAKSEWPHDKEMQTHCISEEKEGYTRLQCLDFGDLANLKGELIESAREAFAAWNEVCDSVESELSAYRELRSFSAEGLSQEVIDEWKTQARKGYEGYYAGQLELLENKVRKHVSILATRQQIDPIKTLLIELEKIVGNECYNGNIQNYGSWGELASEGRPFRYPVKFYTDSGESKKWTVSPDIPSEELITGYYAFGANELNIYRALFKVVSHLREKYGLKV